MSHTAAVATPCRPRSTCGLFDMAVYVIIFVYRTAASADATMATWGGSTVDNLESITEDGGGDQQDNEDEDDDGKVE